MPWYQTDWTLIQTRTRYGASPSSFSAPPDGVPLRRRALTEAQTAEKLPGRARKEILTAHAEVLANQPSCRW